RFFGLVRTKSWFCAPESEPPDSSKGWSAGRTCSTVRCFSGMISSCCARAAAATSSSAIPQRNILLFTFVLRVGIVLNAFVWLAVDRKRPGTSDTPRLQKIDKTNENQYHLRIVFPVGVPVTQARLWVLLPCLGVLALAGAARAADPSFTLTIKN